MQDNPQTTKDKAIASVARAAVAWVNFEDDGRIKGMVKEMELRTRFVNSVSRLQKIRKKKS